MDGNEGVCGIAEFGFGDGDIHVGSDMRCDPVCGNIDRALDGGGSTEIFLPEIFGCLFNLGSCLPQGFQSREFIGRIDPAD